MNYKAKGTRIIETGYEVQNVVDGDGMIIQHRQTRETIEIRLYGIDAPEVKKCRKLIEDERKLHMPGELLMKLGFESMLFLKRIAPVGANCRIEFEKQNNTDFYNRRLAYVYLDESANLNEKMIREGYAKPFSDYYCSELHTYQKLNNEAKRLKKGLYGMVKKF